MEDTRETKRIDQIEPGDVLADYDDGILYETFLTVRCAEPLTDEPGRYHVVFAGGRYTNVRATQEVEIATAAEVKRHEAERRDSEKRARMRAGLMKLIEAIDDGLPLPAYFAIDGACLPDHDAVAAAAALLGVEPRESENGGKKQSDAKADFVPAQGYRAAEVQIRMWHLGGAVES
jgi:hypothetical protein